MVCSWICSLEVLDDVENLLGCLSYGHLSSLLIIFRNSLKRIKLYGWIYLVFNVSSWLFFWFCLGEGDVFCAGGEGQRLRCHTLWLFNIQPLQKGASMNIYRFNIFRLIILILIFLDVATIFIISEYDQELFDEIVDVGPFSTEVFRKEADAHKVDFKCTVWNFRHNHEIIILQFALISQFDHVHRRLISHARCLTIYSDITKL